MPAGTLYLVPAALGQAPVQAILPAEVQQIVRGLDIFLVENAKSARAELRRIGHPRSMRELEIIELPRVLRAADLERLLRPLLAGRAAGLLSEAGLPAIADAGTLVVRAAHEKGIRIVPLVGPSSLFMALAASGLNGQCFAFHGYLPIKESARRARIQELERDSRRCGATQIFIETPYRNERLLAALLDTCHADTHLCVASNLTTARERIITRRISEWRAGASPSLDRQPAVFLIQADGPKRWQHGPAP